MISHKHKCIFIHIPKAAGTSIETFFLNDLGLDFEDKHSLIIGKSTNLHLPPRVISHLSISEMLSQHYISEDIFKSYYKFSFVRHPVDRLFSTYKYWGYSPIITFDIFIKEILPVLIKKNKYQFFLRPQVAYLFDNGKNLMDYTGKFENLNNDFINISKKLGFVDQTLPHINKAKLKQNPLRAIKKIIEHPKLIKYINLSSDKTKTLSKQSIEVIKNIYNVDFKNFNYSI